MKITKKLLLILSMLALPVTLLGQSTIYFPRAFSPADLGGTGFALVNPGPTDASVDLQLLSASGATLSTWTQVVRARGQVARLGSNYFPNATQAGWVRVTSATLGIQGFWIGGDFFTYMDGADGASPATDQVLPLVAPRTEINIANPGSAAISVTIHMREANGVELAAPVAVIIPALGIYQAQASAIFPNENLTQPTHIRLTSSGAFAATSVVSGLLPAVDTGVANGVDVSLASSQMFFPHVANGPLGGQNYSTVVGITNLSTTTQIVTITFTRGDGGSSITVQRSVDGNGTFRDSAQSLFNLSGFENGWVKVTGTAALTGYVAYAETIGGSFAVVPVQVTPRTNLLFLQVADLDPWLTGLALLNATTTPANVEVYAMYPDGGLIGGPSTSAAASFTLNPGQKIAKLLGDDLVGKSAGSGFVYVRTTNNVPLYGLELFFSRNNKVLSNITSGQVASGITFTPPSVAVVSSVSAAETTRGTTLTLTGTGFSTNASDDIVVFTTATGTVDVAASTATATSITVVIPTAAISGPVTIRVSGQTTNAYVIEIHSSVTSIDQNILRRTDGQPSTGIDIYVPRSLGEVLNATQVGVAPLGTISFAMAASADLPRGQTVTLVVSGPGISAANGSSISFSGEGLTASNVRFQPINGNPAMLVTITVDANAEVGPRNIGIKNTNLDQTNVSGGVFVR